MAKKDKKNKDNKEYAQEESAGSKLLTFLIVLFIVIIWLVIFGVLIKFDVGNFGSEVLYPVLKDVPVVTAFFLRWKELSRRDIQILTRQMRESASWKKSWLA